jgi:hypothetical protein
MAVAARAAAIERNLQPNGQSDDDDDDDDDVNWEQNGIRSWRLILEEW